MSCLANVGDTPALLLAATELPAGGAELTTDVALVPVGASCVTFTFRLCRNELAVMNQVELTIEWLTPVDSETLITPESILQPTGVDCQHQVCTLEILSPQVTAPDDCVLWDLSFSIPTGKTGVRVTAEEVGDPANPGTLEVWVAFK